MPVCVYNTFLFRLFILLILFFLLINLKILQIKKKQITDMMEPEEQKRQQHFQTCTDEEGGKARAGLRKHSNES